MQDGEAQPAAPVEGTAAQDELAQDLRERLLAQPELILSDRDLMRALIGAREAEVGENVIDIRGRAMQALEDRLDRLETMHQTVIANAFDNQSGTNTIHRAILSLLEPQDFPTFLEALQSDVAPMLRIDSLHLLIEDENANTLPHRDSLSYAPPGTVARMVAAGRRAPRGNDIVLRPTAAITAPLHVGGGGSIHSEALIPLDLGIGHGHALILMGSRDSQRFAPSQGTDLLRFFAQVFRLTLLRWLAK